MIITGNWYRRPMILIGNWYRRPMIIIGNWYRRPMIITGNWYRRPMIIIGNWYRRPIIITGNWYRRPMIITGNWYRRPIDYNRKLIKVLENWLHMSAKTYKTNGGREEDKWKKMMDAGSNHLMAQKHCWSVDMLDIEGTLQAEIGLVLSRSFLNWRCASSLDVVRLDEVGALDEVLLLLGRGYKENSLVIYDL
ncbi:hypothetical protein BY996DRAFT_8696478 [Phakopsora pachyrhizi]|nr:hypothetical protein BY996DRAFT_8696478 [Phakopsora pachyrhizi]